MDEYNLIRKQLIEEKKEAVLKTAFDLFLSNDIFNITMIDIAKAAGISRATIYRYFNSKEEINFIIASRMMDKIYQVAFKDVVFDSTPEITVGYKNMVRKFDELMDAYKYIAMFDALYTESHPSVNLSNIYKNKYQHLILDKIQKLSEKEIIRHVMMINLAMDFLEDLASHKNLIPLTQSISIKELLHEFEETIDSIMQIKP